ncbi:galactokinase family protein [Paenibacillus sp. W4I10]
MYFGVQEGSKLFSAAGRSEIGGNHMGHNHGKLVRSYRQYLLEIHKGRKM